MKVCGLKLTHDAAVALVEDQQLVFSVEIEKLANNRRYSDLADLAAVPEILAGFGYDVSDVDEWILDGWDGNTGYDLKLLDDGTPIPVKLGPYRESSAFPLLVPAVTGRFSIHGQPLVYSGYSHAAGHVASTYATSPFAHRNESSVVMIWDGGLFPRIYWADPFSGVHSGGELFPLIGHAYAMAGLHFGPFQTLPRETKADELSVAGKLMAYIALGTPQPTIAEALQEIYFDLFESDLPAAREYRATVGGFGSLFELSRPPVDRMFTLLRHRADTLGQSDEDVLATVHQFLEQLLVSRLEEKVRAWKGDGPWNLCLAGGCALNIKWNSALRASPYFRSVWVPPFPNDAGSAIGAATLGTWQQSGVGALQWRVKLGPELGPVTELPTGWTAQATTVTELAQLLHSDGRPVVLLQGRAELGPRARRTEHHRSRSRPGDEGTAQSRETTGILSSCRSDLPGRSRANNLRSGNTGPPYAFRP